MNQAERRRDKYLRHKYGISLEEWNKIFLQQDRACAGCCRPPEHFKHTFHVDHDHATGVVRGLLCWQCNRLLPNRKNLCAIFWNLIAYLDRPPAYLALGEDRICPKRKRKRRKHK